MNFTFPNSQLPIFSNLQEIKNHLSYLLQIENLDTYCSYKFKIIRDTYIYCLCRSCPARLVFIKGSSTFVLHKSVISHQHLKIKQKRSRIIEAIQELPSCFNIQTIKKIIIGRFSISNSTFYKYLRASRSFGDDIGAVLDYLQSYGIFGVKIASDDPREEFPAILLLTSEIMVQKYHQNNKNVKFDLTYNMIRERTINQRQFSVGAFVTQNNNLNIMPVALCILSEESKETFVRLFHQFIYLMKESPRIVVTDEQRSIKVALEELKERGIFTGNHLFDIFHVLRNAKKSLFHKPTINSIIGLSRSSHLIEYQRKKKNCLNNLHDRDVETLANFQQKMTKCCIALIPSIFIGLSCSTNSIEKLNDIMKLKIPYSQNYIKVVGQLSKLFHEITISHKEFKIQKIRVEQFSVLPEVYELRNKLCQPVFRRLMRQLSLSMTCLINCTESQNVYLIAEQDFQSEQFLRVCFNQQQGTWSCECEMTEKIGLPCSHLIKVLILRRQRLISAINEWWILKQNKKQQSKPGIQFRRKTRRHLR